MSGNSRFSCWQTGSRASELGTRTVAVLYLRPSISVPIFPAYSLTSNVSDAMTR